MPARSAGAAPAGPPRGIGRITWLGRVAEGEKLARLRGASVFCAPSLHGESFGVVLIEAMAAGTPVVASSLDGYRNVATDDVDALLTPPGDAIADLVSDLVRTEPATPAKLERHGPARIIALCNQKGGVGKTTTSINLAASLAEYGRRVLAVDFDPQGSLSVGLGMNPHDMELTVYNLLMQRDVDIHDVIVPTSIEGMDLLPSNIDLSAAEVQLVNEVAREQVLERALRQVRDDYDVVLIDCQPSLGLLTVNALTASHGVIIPLTAEFFALRAVGVGWDDVRRVLAGLAS